MASEFNKEFNSYRVGYNSHNPTVTSRTAANVPLFFNNKHLGTLRFVEESPLPPNVLDPVTEDFDVFYHLNRFNDIINILRYEKPLFINVTAPNPSLVNAVINTGLEPSGEEET